MWYCVPVCAAVRTPPPPPCRIICNSHYHENGNKISPLSSLIPNNVGRIDLNVWADTALQPPPPHNFTVSFPLVAGLGLAVLCYYLGLFKGYFPTKQKLSASAGCFLPVQSHLRGKVHAFTLQRGVFMVD